MRVYCPLNDKQSKQQSADLSVHGGADQKLSAVLQDNRAHVEDDPAVVLSL